MGNISVKEENKEENLHGIPTSYLVELLSNPFEDEKSQNDIAALKFHKPVSNYQLEILPCKHKPKHHRPHHQFLRIIRPKQSLISVAAHLKVAGLTPDCKLYLTRTQQDRVNRLYEFAREHRTERKLSSDSSSNTSN
jgi:hypothetical protein